ncbi:MAG: transporter substrate-binding domain-containing protein [Alphaproteobacteria bacterium]|nr:transporter substrate-binding domain-containing protein [Alphaproteobacteria bacterium]
MHRLVWSIVIAVLVSSAAAAQRAMPVCERWNQRIGVVADMFPITMARRTGEIRLGQVDGLAMSVLNAMFPVLHENHEIIIVAFPDSAALQNALISGEVDIGLGLYYDSLAEAHIKFLQPGFFNNLIGALYLDGDSRHETPADFKGMRGVYVGDSDMTRQAGMLINRHQLNLTPVNSDAEALARLETRRAEFFLVDTYRARRLLREPDWRDAGLRLAPALGGRHVFFAISRRSRCMENSNFERRYHELAEDFDVIVSQAASQITW